MSKAPTLDYTRERLQESLHLQITLQDLQSILDNNLFLIILSPNEENLYAWKRSTRETKYSANQILDSGSLS